MVAGSNPVTSSNKNLGKKPFPRFCFVYKAIPLGLQIKRPSKYSKPAAHLTTGGGSLYHLIFCRGLLKILSQTDGFL